MERPEILAPAGDRDCLQAAIRAGADAVYFGLQGFNARARASNFDQAALGATLRELHASGVRGYVTLNTLVFEDELAALEGAVRACAEAGVDAVIVQDLGVLKLVRAIAPDLPIHASTQMTCTDAASVDLARALGASRVILARELSLGDIAAIRRETSTDLEVFVHGALCVAYSGQCLTSEAIGGRSANRGACAQACRLPYELVVDGVLRDLGDRAYLLSPEDLEASAVVPDLVALGVRSLKIEGRLKTPEYVAAATRLYRRAVDAALGLSDAPSDADRQRSLQMYSRGSGPGFLKGVDHQRLVEARACDHRGVRAGTLVASRLGPRRGKDRLVVELAGPLALGDGILVEGGFAGEGEIGGRVWGLTHEGSDVERALAGDTVEVWLGPDRPLAELPAGRSVWKTNDPNAIREVRTDLDRDPHRVRLDVRISGALGEPFVLQGKTERGAEASVTGDAKVEPARTAPLTEEAAREKLGRLGDSPFALGAFSFALPAGAIVPVSSLNRARRALVDALVAAGDRPWATTPVTSADLLTGATAPDRAPPPGGLFVLCRTLDQARAAVDAGADGVYLDFLELTGVGAALRALRARGKVHITLAPPRIRKPGEHKIDRYLGSLEPDAILVRSLGAVAEPSPFPRIGDFSLNVTNRITASALLGAGLVAFTPSFDLDGPQLLGLATSRLAPFAEVVVHHPMPLFHMEHCVIAALLSEGSDHTTCGRPCDRHKVSLRDRAGMDHPVEADVGCRNTVFHAAPQSAAGLLGSLQRGGVRRFRIELVRETAEDVARIVGLYRAVLAGHSSPADVWTRLRADSGYGVARVVRGSLRVISA